MLSVPEMIAAGGLAILAYMGALWLVSLALKDSSIVDIFWGPGFILVSGVYLALAPDGYAPRRLLLLALVIVWGLRLALHIGARNACRGEDFRYRRWRQNAGPRWGWYSLFKVFLLQGAVMWLVSMPLLAGLSAPVPDRLTPLDLLGGLVWAVGFVFEALGDWQLRRFRADPANAGQVMRAGLWRYTRHPNYFGDALVWWGLFLIAAGTPGGWLTVFSPLLMTYLLRRVSGVTLLEESLRRTRPGYADYIASTSAFFPRPPRN